MLISEKRENLRGIVLISLIIICVLAFRRNDAFFNPQLWAEDGPVFVEQFYQNGLSSLITPYAGYSNLIQRLIVAFYGTLHVNLIYIPTLYVYTCLALMIWVAVSIWRTATVFGLKNSVAYGVFFVFTPVASDVFLNITNLNGIMSLYLINFLVVRTITPLKGTGWSELLAIFVISLSGPTSILLCPVVAAIVFIERKSLTIRQILPLLVILVCGTLQLLCVKFIDKDFYRGISGEPEKFHLVRFFANNVGDLFLRQYGVWPDMSDRSAFLVQCILLLGLASLFALCFVRIKLSAKYVILSSMALYIASVVYSYWPNESQLYALRNASRYFIVPYTLIGWIVILAMDKAIRKEHLAAYAAFFVLQKRCIQFELADKHWKEQAKEYREGKRDMMQINPEGWQFKLPKK